jgi:hypothetical protein
MAKFNTDYAYYRYEQEIGEKLKYGIYCSYTNFTSGNIWCRW